VERVGAPLPQTNPTVKFAVDKAYYTDSFYENIDQKFGRTIRARSTLSNEVVFFEDGLKETKTLYGPQEFAAIVLIDDNKNTGIDITQTRIKIHLNIRAEGVELKNVSVLGKPTADIINQESTLTYRFEISNNQVLHKEDITRICLLNQNVFSEINVIQDIDPNIHIITPPIAFGNIDIYSINFQPNVVGDYQGPVYGYVQLKNITWNPKSIFDPEIVYDEGPDIQFIHLTGHTVHIHVYANIVDRHWPIKETKYMLMTNTGYTSFFATANIQTKLDVLDTYGTTYETPSEYSTSLFVEIRDELTTVFINNSGDTGSFVVEDELYTLIMYAKDVSLLENYRIITQNVVLYEPIQFGNIGFYNGMNNITVMVPLEFNAVISNMDVYCGLFEFNPGIDTEMMIPRMKRLLNVLPSTQAFQFFFTTDTESPIVNHRYYVVIYAKSAIDDLAYTAYSNVKRTTYTRSASSQPLIHNVKVNFDRFL
jgi:archaellin